MCSPVKISTTPDAFNAFDVSIFLIFALACGDLMNIAYVWFAIFMSAVYLPLPVKNLLSSFLSTLEPTKLAYLNPPTF